MRTSTSRHRPHGARLARTLLGAGALALSTALVVTACAPDAPPARHPNSSASSTPSAAALAAPHEASAPSSAASTAPEPHPVNPCAENRAAKLVKVSLKKQHLWMCAHTTLVRDTAITSGKSGADTETPRGHYRIQGRNKNTVLTLTSGKTYNVKYWIPFDAPLFGFHDASWQHFAYGSPQYRTDGSHGCVHMPLPAIAFLYRWSEIGTTRVVIA